MKAKKRAPASRPAAAPVRQAGKASSRKQVIGRVKAAPTRQPEGAPLLARPVARPSNPAQPALPRPRIPPLLLEKEPPVVSALAEGSGPATSIRATHITLDLPPRLSLTPRDPHWLHAHWEFAPDQVRDARAHSEGGQLALRLFEHSPSGRLVSETNIRPEASRWFVHVEQAGTRYAGQLGYYDRAHKWIPLASSPPVRTPPNGPSAHGGFELATLTRDGTLERHGTSHTLVAPWSPEREAALHALARGGSPVFSGSESSAWVGQAVSSPGGASWGAPWSFSSLMVSSAGFRLEVNAELIVYGATEPDAELSIGGKRVAVESDGSFRFRFALPDGEYELPIEAKSARGDDRRQAALSFSRGTRVVGGVGQHPSEPGLQPPG